jgi:hypothetical protein
MAECPGWAASWMGVAISKGTKTQRDEHAGVHRVE